MSDGDEIESIMKCITVSDVLKTTIEEAKKIAAEKAKVEERNRIEQEQKDKAERERLAIIEAEEKAAQAPDIEKLSIFYGAIANIHIPQMKSKKYKAIVSDIEVLITGILAKFPK